VRILDFMWSPFYLLSKPDRTAAALFPHLSDLFLTGPTDSVGSRSTVSNKVDFLVEEGWTFADVAPASTGRFRALIPRRLSA